MANLTSDHLLYIPIDWQDISKSKLIEIQDILATVLTPTVLPIVKLYEELPFDIDFDVYTQKICCYSAFNLIIKPRGNIISHTGLIFPICDHTLTVVNLPPSLSTTNSCSNGTHINLLNITDDYIILPTGTYICSLIIAPVDPSKPAIQSIVDFRYNFDINQLLKLDQQIYSLIDQTHPAKYIKQLQTCLP